MPLQSTWPVEYRSLWTFSMYGLCFLMQPPPIKPLDDQLSLADSVDDQLSLADLDAVKVVGKGNGGIVQLVRHKWTSQFFAVKV